jgi:hypothetical protein
MLFENGLQARPAFFLATLHPSGKSNVDFLLDQVVGLSGNFRHFAHDEKTSPVEHPLFPKGQALLLAQER